MDVFMDEFWVWLLAGAHMDGCDYPEVVGNRSVGPFHRTAHLAVIDWRAMATMPGITIPNKKGESLESS